MKTSAARKLTRPISVNKLTHFAHVIAVRFLLIYELYTSHDRNSLNLVYNIWNASVFKTNELFRVLVIAIVLCF